MLLEFSSIHEDFEIMDDTKANMNYDSTRNKLRPIKSKVAKEFLRKFKFDFDYVPTLFR